MRTKEIIEGKLLGLPVLVKVMGIVMGLAVFLCVAQIWQIQYSYSPLEQREVEADTSFLAQALAAGAAPVVRKGTPGELQKLLDEGTQVSPAPHTTVARAQVVASNGVVLARTTRPPVGEAGEREVERSAPLTSVEGGKLSVTLTDGHVDYEVNWHKRRIVLTTLIITVLGLVVTWWLMGLVTRPLLELGQTVRLVKGGDYQARAPVRAKDELGDLAVAFNDMTAALQVKEATNQRLLKRLLVVSEEERKRFAHELNEQTGQALCSLVAGLAAVEGGASQERLPELRALASQTVREVHDLSLAIHPTALEDLGLEAAVQTLCEGLAQRLGMRVDCVVVGFEGRIRLPAEIEVALFRITEEAITAVAKQHRASAVEFLLERKADSVRLVIECGGLSTGAPDSQAQTLSPDDLDLLAIEKRAKLLSGSLRLESDPGGRTSLFVEIPLTALGQP